MVAERCQSLKLVHAAECLAELVEEASREELSPVKFLDRVLEREIERKDERRIATSLKLSGLPVGKTPRGLRLELPARGRSIQAGRGALERHREIGGSIRPPGLAATPRK